MFIEIKRLMCNIVVRVASDYPKANFFWQQVLLLTAAGKYFLLSILKWNKYDEVFCLRLRQFVWFWYMVMVFLYRWCLISVSFVFFDFICLNHDKLLLIFNQFCKLVNVYVLWKWIFKKSFQIYTCIGFWFNHAHVLFTNKQLTIKSLKWKTKLKLL